jgi:hypothetical protein
MLRNFCAEADDRGMCWKRVRLPNEHCDMRLAGFLNRQYDGLLDHTNFGLTETNELRGKMSSGAP